MSPAPCQGKELESTFSTIDDVFSFVSFFNQVLEKEKIKQKEEGGRKQRLFDGRLIGSHNNTYQYTFESDSELHFPDDTPITIWLNEQKITGILSCAVDFNVTISINEDLGDSVSSIEISSEPWQLIESLQKRLEFISSYASDIVNDLVCNGYKNIENSSNGAIIKGMENAVEMSFSNTVTFVWGPPGTGKTETLSRIALKHIESGHRVLMVSYSNVSVDGAILRVYRNDKDYKPGRLLRYGYPRDKELLENENLTSYNQAISRFPDLKKKQRKLMDERKNLPRESKRFTEINEELKNIRNTLDQVERELVSKARFVATTISKTIVDPLLYEGDFDVVLFDEASMAYIPQVVFAASLAKRNFICLGDFKQLPPISQSENNDLKIDIFQYCGITNAVRNDKKHNWMCLLDTQHRMHPQIADFSSKGMYGSLIKSDSSMTSTRSEIVQSKPFNGKPMYLVDLSGMMTVCQRNSDNSHFNVLSALITIGIALEAARHFEVGIISPYSAQAKLYNAMSRDIAVALKDYKPIVGATVHQFQGSEKDIIVYDTVDCYRQPYIGTMLTSQDNNYANRLFNVAITRSKGKFIAVSNVDYLKTKGLSHNLLLGQFIDKYESAKQFIDGDELESVFSGGIEHFYKCYYDNSELADYQNDIANAEEEIRIDIPEGLCSDERLEEISNDLIEVKSRGVEVIIRTNDIYVLPKKLQAIAIKYDYAWNPITIIDRRIVWFGMPYSESDFKAEGSIVQSIFHPVIRFKGAYTALSLIGYLEMNKKNNAQSIGSFPAEDIEQIRKYILSNAYCPNCGGKMNLRKAKRTGNAFLGCAKFPICKGTLEIEVGVLNDYLDDNKLYCENCGGRLRARSGAHGGVYLQCQNDNTHRFSLI